MKRRRNIREPIENAKFWAQSAAELAFNRHSGGGIHQRILWAVNSAHCALAAAGGYDEHAEALADRLFNLFNEWGKK